MIEKGNIIEGTVSGLAFGGQGVLKKDGLVVFVPYAAPGDLIRCQVTAKKSSFAEGKLLEVLKPAPERIKPLCPYFGTCGGCQLQHLSYAAQAENKRTLLKDALKRIGKLESIDIAPIVPSSQQWSYRRHITLTLKPGKRGYKGGYIATDNTTLLEVGQCPIYLDPSNPLFDEVRQFVWGLEPAGKEEGRLTILKASSGSFILHFQFKNMPGNFAEIAPQAMQRCNQWRGILARAPRKTLVYGQTDASMECEGFRFCYSPLSFIQNHPEQSLNIYRRVLALAKESGAKAAFDLYCGIGVTSVLLAASGMEVHGCEFNAEAVRLAKANAQANGVGNVEFEQGDVGKLLAGLFGKCKPGLVLVNPPREGLSNEVVKELLGYRPDQVLYVSCMPSTLARDLRKFVDGKYAVTYCEPYDMFPQTTHLETVVRLEYTRS